MEDLRKTMGVCPQHDILFDDLSVEEHLTLFATFKGTDPVEIPNEVNKMIEAIDLKAKRDDLAKNLSGGQKRRLSVGIAFIGNSKLILLDEPTSVIYNYIYDYIYNYNYIYVYNYIYNYNNNYKYNYNYIYDYIK